MFESYKSLIGKNDSEKNESSPVNKTLNFLFRPYKSLIQVSDDKVKVKKSSKPKKEETPKQEKKKRISVRRRLSEPKRTVLWKKK